MIDPEFVFENKIEAALWGALAFVLFAAGVRSRRWRRQAFLSAAVLAVFGASDLVETHTGAWWRPRWLLVWKSLCVIALLASTTVYYARKRAATESPPPTH